LISLISKITIKKYQNYSKEQNCKNKNHFIKFILLQKN